MTGARILAQLQLISTSLGNSKLDKSRVEYRVTYEEWTDLVQHLRFYGILGDRPFFNSEQVIYMGITVHNPHP